MVALDKKLEANGQFFHVANVTHMKIVYCSNGCHRFFGVKPEEVDPAVYFERTHPDDIQRHNVGRSKMLRMGNEMFINRTGKRLEYWSVLRIVHCYCDNAGIKTNVTPHTFRRSCTTELVKGGTANLYHIKELLGHEELETLKPYINLTITDLKKTHAKCHPRERDN